MKKSKVLFILHLPPPMHGAAIVGDYIKKSLTINVEFDADYINLATNKVLSESGKSSIKKIFTFLYIFKQLFIAMLQKNYDLCYVTLTATGLGFYKDIVLICILKAFKKKIIYHFHNKGVSSAKKNRFTRSLYRYALSNTKCILLSRYLYQDIKQFVNEKDVFYCPYGIPIRKLDNYQDELLRRQPDAPCRLLFLSNMIREKGVFVLLDACKQLRERHIRFECHYVGGWSDISEETFRKEIDVRKLTDSVFVHGPKYNEDKEKFFLNSDIFLFPTYYHYETFGLVNLEAMQHGIVVISTPEGGIPDVVVDGETGFLVPQRDAIALAEKLAILIQEPDLRLEMGIAGKRRFDELFTLEKFETNISHILKTAIIQP